MYASSSAARSAESETVLKGARCAPPRLRQGGPKARRWVRLNGARSTPSRLQQGGPKSTNLSATLTFDTDQGIGEDPPADLSGTAAQELSGYWAQPLIQCGAGPAIRANAWMARNLLNTS